MENEKLREIAKNIRRDIIEMLYHSQSGHPGGSLSLADIISVLYWDEMNVDSNNPKMENRDRFILSKGHAAPVLYAALMEKGYLDKKYITELRKFGSPLQGHPDMKKVSGVEISSGSLGQGLSVGNGMALSAKMSGLDYRVYVALGDGELQEGQVWEAVMTSAHYKIDNLVAIVDYNNLQIDGKVSDVMEVYSISEKFRAFNWHVVEIDGHNIEDIKLAFDNAREMKGKPTAIIAKTVKGKGVSFMENNAGFHGVAPNEDEYKQAMEELK